MLGWVVQVFFVVLAVLITNFVLARVLRRLRARVERSANKWDDIVFDAATRPLRLLVWVIGLGMAGEIIRQDTGAALFAAVGPLRTIGVIVALVWFLVRLVVGLEEAVIEHRQRLGQDVDRTTVKALGRLLRASVLITGVLVTLQSLGFSISGVLAFGGIGGLAIGFAAKDILANFFGGLMIYLDRPFAVGDWIRSPDRDIEGTVEDIGWRLTRIRGFDKRPIYVPNSLFASMAVVNPSRMSHRRINETIGVRYDDIAAMGPIVRDVESMLRADPEIDVTQTLMVNFNAFGSSSLDFFIYCFTRTTDWAHYHAVKEAVLLRVAQIIAAHGAEIAFPTRTVHLAGTDADARAAELAR
ncbi:mechanosensitive ion channel protein MscS [Acidihalobacter ferrooxydans]|uniref:Mechanosensitive ion channel protein MscS n=2 Tax=Acidihalobacter ferrooxydans TaxID=1765967 RepID=A0A1P8ULE1_9GAMM|nr:mechanosensitive ion channel protein MscS [Acidihalobacter ferrooxydans]